MKDVVSCEKPRGAAKQALIRGCPNGATQPAQWPVIPQGRRTRGTETSQYPEEKKSNEIALVAASERALAQTEVFGLRGCRVPMWDAKG